MSECFFVETKKWMPSGSNYQEISAHHIKCKQQTSKRQRSLSSLIYLWSYRSPVSGVSGSTSFFARGVSPIWSKVCFNPNFGLNELNRPQIDPCQPPMNKDEPGGGGLRSSPCHHCCQPGIGHQSLLTLLL